MCWRRGRALLLVRVYGGSRCGLVKFTGLTWGGLRLGNNGGLYSVFHEA